MPIRVLLSDDESLARERLRRMLEDEPDLEIVAECGDGKSAIALIKREKPDLVFLDVQMPEVDGFGVVAALQGEHDAAHHLCHRLRPVCDEGLRGARARLSAEAGGERSACRRRWATPASSCSIPRKRCSSAACSICWPTWSRGSMRRSALSSRPTARSSA